MTASQLAKRLRLPLGFVFGILYFWLAPRWATPERLMIGALVAAIGLFVRGWAAGHIVKNAQLATTGPYAHVRNPLYFGSFLLAAGFAIAAHPLLLVFVIVFWAVIYFPTMERERQHILGRFPDTYPAFAENVPLFVPRLTPWRQPGVTGERWSPSLYLKHKEWQAALVYVVAIAWIAWRMPR